MIFWGYTQIWHHLQIGPGPRPRPSKNRTLILRTLEKTGPRNLIETKDQIEYILRYSNFVKKKSRIRIFREKLDLLNMLVLQLRILENMPLKL